MEKNKTLWGTSLFVCGILLTQTAWAATPATPNPQQVIGGSEPAAQINQTRAYLEEQALRKRLEQEQKEHASQVEAPSVAKEEAPKIETVFTLSDINFSSSQVFSKAELDKIKAPYLHKSIDINLLYHLVNELNELYRQKGYVVCRAYLPMQTISGGVVRILLVEGKTGNVEVIDNKSTSKGY